MYLECGVNHALIDDGQGNKVTVCGKLFDPCNYHPKIMVMVTCPECLEKILSGKRYAVER